MPTAPDLKTLHHPLLWRGKDLLNQSLSQHPDRVLSSGHPELDRQLQGGGWPRQGLVDLLLPHAGIGELRLLLPLLELLTQTNYVVWINPPFIPYAAALHACGVNTRNLLVVRTRNHEETLWSMERCCLSGGCAAVLAWPEERKLNIKETRRLQLAARSGQTLAIFFRPISAVERSSLAELRLALRPTENIDQLTVDIIKRKGGWPVQDIRLSLTASTQTRYDVMESLHQQLALWQKHQWQRQELSPRYPASDDTPYADVALELNPLDHDAPAVKPLGGLH